MTITSSFMSTVSLIDPPRVVSTLTITHRRRRRARQTPWSRPLMFVKLTSDPGRKDLHHAPRHRPWRHVPRLRASGPHGHPAPAQRHPGRRPARAHAGARPLLPEGAPAAPAARGLLSAG